MDIRLRIECNYLFQGIDSGQGSLPSNLNFHSSKSPLTDYQTFDRGNKAILPQMENQGGSDSHVHHSHQENSLQVTNGRKIALRDFFTVLALSFHAVFEGLAIGLEASSSDIWILFAGNIESNINLTNFVFQKYVRHFQYFNTCKSKF